jgi:hypothetical protein
MKKQLGYRDACQLHDAKAFQEEMAAEQNGKPLLYLDIDDVIANCKGGLFNRALNVGLGELPEPVDFEFSNWTPLQRDFAYQCFQDFYFYYQLQPHRGAKDALWRLAQSYELTGITARAYNKHKKTHNELIQHVTERWLYIWELPVARVVYQPSADKVHWILSRERRGVALVEDNAQTALGAAQNGLLTFLIDRSWNQDAQAGTLLKRVTGLAEVTDRLDFARAVADAQRAGIWAGKEGGQ